MVGSSRPQRKIGRARGRPLKFLSADQFLLTTLVVKLAVMAVLATMLARYHRFRHILIFERRGWHDRLVFTAAFGIPLMAGVAARLLLSYKAADLTLEGAFLAGLIAGPYAGALVGILVGTPALVGSLGVFIALYGVLAVVAWGLMARFARRELADDPEPEIREDEPELEPSY